MEPVKEGEFEEERRKGRMWVQHCIGSSVATANRIFIQSTRRIGIVPRRFVWAGQTPNIWGKILFLPFGWWLQQVYVGRVTQNKRWGTDVSVEDKTKSRSWIGDKIEGT
jgi:hypothetical protein